MTDEERKNRNPAPETLRVRLADCPEIPVGELEMNRVYILQTKSFAASLNFVGTQITQNPITLDAERAYKFYGPRIDMRVALRLHPDGCLQDLEGNRITLRKYNGPDQ